MKPASHCFLYLVYFRRAFCVCFYLYITKSFRSTRLEAWLQRHQTSLFTRSSRWVWMKLDANGFRVTCGLSSGDTAAEEICMEDILGVLCSHVTDAAKESEIDCPYERAAYFRRTNLHASEDASDLQTLVTQVEAEYLSQNGQTPQANVKAVKELDDIALSDKEFAILTTKMGYYRFCCIYLLQQHTLPFVEFPLFSLPCYSLTFSSSSQGGAYHFSGVMCGRKRTMGGNIAADHQV